MRKATCIFTGESCGLEVYENGLYEYSEYKFDGYIMSGFGRRFLEQKGYKLPHPLILNCIHENILARERGYTILWKTSKETEIDLRRVSGRDILQKNLDAFEGVPIDHAAKLDAVLRLAADKSRPQSPFAAVSFTNRDAFMLKCNGLGELRGWLATLRGDGLLHSFDAEVAERTMNGGDDEEPGETSEAYSITPKGWLRVREITTGAGGNKVFIAMAFRDNPQRDEIEAAIRQSCSDAGLEAFTIDRKEYLGKITDEIVASINESRFIVAEFTKNNHGVYWEAGYASGRGIPVIHVVQDRDLDALHFDTKQINHIVWSSCEDLHDKLLNRAKVLLGSRTQ